MAQAKKVLCVGPDLAVDKTILIDGFSAGRRYRPKDVLTLASGKGCNVARVLQTLGAQPTVLGWAGGHNGAFIREGMETLGVKTVFIPISAESRVCVAILDRANHTLTEINETNPAIQPGEVEALYRAYLRLLPEFEVVTLSGRLPPGVETDFYARLIEAARQAGKPVLLDTYGESLRRAVGARPTLVKPNLQEFNELLGEELSGMDAIAAAARHMAGQIGSQVVVTLGERGMVAADGDRLFTAQAPRVPALSAIGSGDAFLAGMAAVLLEGGSFVEMLRMGLAASAANTLQVGAAILRREQVEALYGQAEVVEVTSAG